MVTGNEEGSGSEGVRHDASSMKCQLRTQSWTVSIPTILRVARVICTVFKWINLAYFMFWAHHFHSENTVMKWFNQTIIDNVHLYMCCACYENSCCASQVCSCSSFLLCPFSETLYCDSSSSSWTLVSATFGPWSGLSGTRLLVAARPTIFTHLNRGTFDPGIIQVWSRYAPGILQASY